MLSPSRRGELAVVDSRTLAPLALGARTEVVTLLEDVHRWAIRRTVRGWIVGIVRTAAVVLVGDRWAYLESAVAADCLREELETHVDAIPFQCRVRVLEALEQVAPQKRLLVDYRVGSFT